MWDVDVPTKYSVHGRRLSSILGLIWKRYCTTFASVTLDFEP